MLAALRFAIGLLTAIPVGAVPAPDRRRIGRALVLAPLTTLPVMIITAGAGAVAGTSGVSPWLLAVVVLITGVLLSRAMHLDGLADTADGLSAGFDRERSLRAMKASDVGPSGVVALVLVLLLQASALSVLLAGPTWATALAVIGWPASRLGLLLACARGVPAASGSGLGGLVAGTVALRPAVLALAVAVVGGGTLLLATGGDPWLAIGMIVVVTVFSTLIIGIARRRLGGITGDVLGAVVECSLTAAWVSGAVAVGLA